MVEPRKDDWDTVLHSHCSLLGGHFIAMDHPPVPPGHRTTSSCGFSLQMLSLLPPLHIWNLLLHLQNVLVHLLMHLLHLLQQRYLAILECCV